MADERKLILSEIERVRAMLFKNSILYDLACDDAETEALIYERKALMIRYDSLIAKAKELGLRKGEMLCGK